MKIKCGKDYEQACPNSAQNIREVAKYICDDITYGIIEERPRLTGDNRAVFKKIWGRQTFCWSSSHRFWVWVHYLPNCVVIVLTAGEKGTCYEYVPTGDTSKITKEIVSFLQETRAKLNKLSGDNRITDGHEKRDYRHLKWVIRFLVFVIIGRFAYVTLGANSKWPYIIFVTLFVLGEIIDGKIKGRRK